MKLINEQLSRKELLLCVFLIAFGTAIRLWNLSGYSLVLDESQSVWQASHSPIYIFDYSLKNVHLPLHNLLLHGWMSLFGSSATAVRWLAVIPGILTLPYEYLLGKELLGKKAGILTLLIAVVSPFWIWYSREIRMYSLLILVTTMSYFYYLKLLKYNGNNYFILYILTNLVGMYTHYFFFLVLIVQAAFLLYYINNPFNSKNEAYRVFKKIALATFIEFVLFAPWAVSFFIAHSTGSFEPDLAQPTTFNILLSFFQFTFGFQSDQFTSRVMGFWPLVILLVFIFLVKRDNPYTKEVFLITLGVLLPVLIVYIVSVTLKPIYLTRYLTPVTPLFIIFLAWFHHHNQGRVKNVVVVMFFTSILFSLANQFLSFYNPAKEDYQNAISFLNTNATDRDLVVAAPPYLVYPLDYYYEGNAKVITMPIWDKTKGTIPTVTDTLVRNDTDIATIGHNKLYVLMSLNLEGAPLVKEYYDNNYKELDSIEFSKDLWVNVYQLEYSSEKVFSSVGQ